MATWRPPPPRAAAGGGGGGARNTGVGLPQLAPAAAAKGDPDEEWRWSDLPTGKKVFLGGLGALSVAVLLVILPIIYSTSTRVGGGSNAVIIYFNGEIDDTPQDPGRRFHGADGSVQEYPRFDATIEYAGADPVRARVEDGQLIDIDVSFQFSIPKSKIVDIYRLHKGSFVTTLQTIARALIRDEAAKYNSTQFFANRTFIAAQIRAKLEREGSARLIEITGFQIRNIALPAQLITNLRNVQTARLEARAREERLALERINATTSALQLQLRTARERHLAEYNQTTAILLALEQQNRSRIEETTAQELARINGNADRNITLYVQGTAGLVEEINLNISIQNETTRRAVNRIQFESETNLTVYRQDTRNLELGFAENVTRINEQAKQDVATIVTNTSETVLQFEAGLRAALAEALAHRRTLLAEVDEVAANATIAAKGAAYGELPPAVYLAEVMGNGTLSKTSFYDANMSSLTAIASAT